MSNFVTYATELNATMHNSVTFQNSSAPVPVAPTKGLASKHFFMLQPMLTYMWSF